MLVEQHHVEEKLAAHILLADLVFFDALRLGPIGDMLVQQCLRIARGTFLAVVVHRKGQLLAGRVRGPGHNSILTEGEKHYLVHHYYDAEDGGRSRLQIRPLSWSRDDWPIPGEPLPAATMTNR